MSFLPSIQVVESFGRYSNLIPSCSPPKLKVAEFVATNVAELLPPFRSLKLVNDPFSSLNIPHEMIELSCLNSDGPNPAEPENGIWIFRGKSLMTSRNLRGLYSEPPAISIVETFSENMILLGKY